MIIKEIETLTGMDRANIRFYEREGLISPKRMKNGYRDYSEDDLQMLLRIKLLRSLHISLEEIRLHGSRDLADTLSQQIAKLVREKQDVSYAQDLCRLIQEDRVTFTELNAKKYLDGLNRAIEETGSLYFTVNGDELPQVFHPWRRFLARNFDIVLYNILWLALLGFGFQVNMAARSRTLVDLFVAMAIMLALEPLWLHLFGTTPGKAIFGLRIETPDGRQLTYSEGLERTWGVIGAGLGYNIPVYNLVRLWNSYKLCSENEPQPWDESIAYTIKDTKWCQGLVFIGANVLIIAVLVTMISAQQIPPNRGDLTIAEFVENHNYYARLFGIDLGNKYLNEDGKWAEKSFDGTIYIDPGYIERPEYHFTLENGSVTGVSFAVEIKNDQGLLDSYDAQMVLASLAFAGAQKETGLLSKMPARITAQIDNSTFKSFHFTEAGITFNCDIDYSGYTDGHYFLFPEENAPKIFFSHKFSIIKDK